MLLNIKHEKVWNSLTACSIYSYVSLHKTGTLPALWEGSLKRHVINVLNIKAYNFKSWR